MSVCDGPKGHDYRQVNTFRVNDGPLYQTFRCDPCGGRYTSPIAGPDAPAPSLSAEQHEMRASWDTQQWKEYVHEQIDACSEAPDTMAWSDMRPDPTPDEQALAEILWDSSGESIGWLEAFKHAQAIIAAGWVPRCGDYDCCHTDHADHAGGR